MVRNPNKEDFPSLHWRESPNSWVFLTIPKLPLLQKNAPTPKPGRGKPSSFLESLISDVLNHIHLFSCLAPFVDLK